MDEGMLVFLIILGICILLVPVILLSNAFYDAAVEKGHYDRKYFWYCIFFGIFGYLLVIALPDIKSRGNNQDNETKKWDDSLPEI